MSGKLSATQRYLIAYNSLQTVGWTYLLSQVVNYHLEPKEESLYDTVKWTVNIFQNAAILEIFHSLLGLVRSSVHITTPQVFSRVMVVCGVLLPTIAARNSPGLPLLLLAWSVTEIIRYGYYTLNLIDKIPYFLTWLRYTTFIVLYPIGVTGELLCIYSAQKEFGASGKWSIGMPNTLNFSFSYQLCLIWVMLLYIPFFPKLYMHMFVQRKKIIGGGDSETKKSD